MGDKVKLASELFNSGRFCSQAVLGAFCEGYGIEKDTAFRISCGLNSGVRCAEICGAISGAAMVVGLKYGDTTDVCNLKTEEIIKLFGDKNSSVVCREIMGCDISTPDGKEKAEKEKLFSTRCLEMVISAAQILEDLGY